MGKGRLMVSYTRQFHSLLFFFTLGVPCYTCGIDSVGCLRSIHITYSNLVVRTTTLCVVTAKDYLCPLLSLFPPSPLHYYEGCGYRDYFET